MLNWQATATTSFGGACPLAEALIQRLGLLWSRGGHEARPVALRRVRDQRELADHKGGAVRVDQALVELDLRVLEDPQARDAPGQPFGVARLLAPGDPEQHARPRAGLAPDLVRYTNACATDALHELSLL